MKLTVRHAALEERYDELQRSARQYRDSRDSWTKYAQSLEGKMKKLEKKLQRNGHVDARSPAPDNAKRQPLQPVAVDAGRSADKEAQAGNEGHDELPPIPPSIASETFVKIKEEPSSDAAVVVSERRIRKRKLADDDAEAPTPPRRIKSEQSASSDPIITGEVPTFCPHESIDLDEEERGMPTPRKQRPLADPQLREEGVAPEEDEVPIKRRFAGALPSGSALPSPSGKADTGLTPKLPRTHQHGRSPIKPGWTRSSGIADVAEETFESFHSPSPRQAGKGANQKKTAPGRLHSLLNQPTPEKAGGFLPQARLGRGSPISRPGREDVENLPPQENIRQVHDTTKGAPATPLRRQAQAKAKVGRLRDRPLAELRPEDFKVNPKSNNGYTHAFDEVVRNKGERAELAGCTDPNCCGRQFRAMAESELSAAGPGVLSRVADTKMMEDYLGNESYQLVEMTREERREIWLKAKIQDLANRYGRHRHRFARRPSPPGYWNPDFPSTQEIEQNKQEAEKLERGVVEERWREAMRGGGRWLFRDE